MKNKLQYLIIAILIVSNIYFIFNLKKSRVNNPEFKREMNYLKNRIDFNEEQLKLAIAEYKRYDSKKRA